MMILRYFVKIPLIAVAESDATAERLIARGYHECTRAYYMTWWAMRDGARQAELVKEDAVAIQKMSYAERVRRGV